MLDTVTDCAALVVPMAWAAYVSDAGVKVTAGPDAPAGGASMPTANSDAATTDDNPRSRMVRTSSLFEPGPAGVLQTWEKSGQTYLSRPHIRTKSTPGSIPSKTGRSRPAGRGADRPRRPGRCRPSRIRWQIPAKLLPPAGHVSSRYAYVTVVADTGERCTADLAAAADAISLDVLSPS